MVDLTEGEDICVEDSEGQADCTKDPLGALGFQTAHAKLQSDLAQKNCRVKGGFGQGDKHVSHQVPNAAVSVSFDESY